MSATDYTRYPRIGVTAFGSRIKPKADALAKKATRTELENREHICALIQKAIEDDNLHAANWLRGHLTKQESDNG